MLFANPSYPLRLRPLRGDLKANELITVYESVLHRVEQTLMAKRQVEDVLRNVTKTDMQQVGMALYLADKANKIIAKEMGELEEYLKTLPQC